MVAASLVALPRGQGYPEAYCNPEGNRSCVPCVFLPLALPCHCWPPARPTTLRNRQCRWAISRDATKEEWQDAVQKAIAARFGRYEGDKLYNIGISIDGFALAPPGVPLVLKPKSVLVITANVWDDKSQKKLNAEGKQLTIFEHMSAETVIGSGVTQSKAKQMEILAYNAAKAVENWLLENPEWFGLTKAEVKANAAARAATKPAAKPAAKPEVAAAKPTN